MKFRLHEVAAFAPDGGAAPAADPAPGATPAAAGTADPPPAEPTKTLANGGEAPKADPAPRPAVDWPTLRKEIAGDDQALANELERTADLSALGKRFKGLLDSVRRGEVRSAEPPKDATPEQMTVWRKQAGVPDTWEGYAVELPSGYKASKEVGELLEGFKKHAHEANLPGSAVAKAAEWFLSQDAAAAERRSTEDQAFREEAEDALRSKWGTDFKGNISAVRSLFGGNEEMFNLVMGGRGADGKLIGDNPKVMQWLLDIGLTANPNLRQYAGDGTMTEGNVVAELKEISKLIKNNDPGYYKDERKQARFRELVTFADARGIAWQ